MWSGCGCPWPCTSNGRRPVTPSALVSSIGRGRIREPHSPRELEPAMSTASPRIDYADAFPASTKVYLAGDCAGERLDVPMRQIALSGGEPALQVYDTSGPQDCDVRLGLAPIRSAWIAR